VLTNVTDRRTDGRTDAKRRHDRSIAKACSGKNLQKYLKTLKNVKNETKLKKKTFVNVE